MNKEEKETEGVKGKQSLVKKISCVGKTKSTQNALYPPMKKASESDKAKEKNDNGENKITNSLHMSLEESS